jgi:iron complex outermembrane receptor protein
MNRWSRRIPENGVFQETYKCKKTNKSKVEKAMMNRIKMRQQPLLAIAVAVAMAPDPALAQLEEIIVTAQKRSQSIQDVPLAITAVGGDLLDESSIANAQSYWDFVPGITGKTSGSGTTRVSVRGITTNDFGIGGDASIGIYRNGIYEETIQSYYDLERVEFLRGPQGLLFGRGSASGAVNMITTKADSSGTYGEIELGGGERGQKRGRILLNAPLGDKWTMRLAAIHTEEDSWIDNAFTGDDLSGEEKDAIRLSLGYSGEVWQVDAVFDYEDRSRTAVLYNVIDENRNPVTGDINTINSDLGDEPRDDREFYSLGLIASRELGSTTLTSLTGFRSSERDYYEDFDGGPTDFVQYSELVEVDYFSQELRLVSNGDGPWDWFAGASVYTKSSDGNYYAGGEEDVSCQVFAGVSCADAIPGFTPLEIGYAETGTGESEAWGAAIYGELGYALSEAWRVSFGIRYNYDDREFTLFSNPVEGDLYNGWGRLQFLYPYESIEKTKTSDSWDFLAPRILVEYTPTEDLMVFGSVTQGFKPGGFDTFTVSDRVPGFPTDFAALGGDVNSFDEEKLISYEIGIKGTAADNTFSYAVTAFYYEYEDLQQLVALAGDLFPSVHNVGEAEGTGIETEFAWAPTDYFDAAVTFAWLDTELTEVELAVCSEPDGGSCVGNSLKNSPEFSGSARLSARYPIGEHEIFGIAEYVYADDYFSRLNNAPLNKVDSYEQVNLRAGVHLDDRLTIRVFVENLTDEQYYPTLLDFGGLGFNLGLDPVRPRTWGFDVAYRFGGR